MAERALIQLGTPTNAGWLRRAIVCLTIACGLSSIPATAEETWLWFRDGLPTAEAHQALDILLAATTEGLNPSDYSSKDLASALDHSSAAGGLTESEIQRLDSALTSAMRRYLTDLHSGRVAPNQAHATYSAKPAKFNADTYLHQALSEGKLAEYAAKAAPSSLFYAELRKALQYYRQLEQHPAWQAQLPPLPARKLEVGQEYAGTKQLAQRLESLGDLSAETGATAVYDQTLAAGIRAFQQRHGLDVDGVIGKQTMSQLQVTPAQRVEQITLSMERLRWTPLQSDRRIIYVNIPEFALRAFENDGQRMALRLFSKIVVGKADKARTPVFDEVMRYIEFSPYWNVPPSIAKAETIPKLRHDPAYFDEQGFEFVGPDKTIYNYLSSANLEAVLRSELRIRQRPGPENALGNIKFIFPNHNNIYMHDTPAKRLFEKERRDFSHGCIRVQAPFELAQFVLGNDPAWDETNITQAMEKGESKTIRLREPIPVVIAYQTAMVGNDERIYFFPDIYGYDQMLEEALRQRHRA